MPVGRPVHFRITSASVMNAFFVPRLGSQVYAMAGMQTQLSLIADKAGAYDGISANFSGDGFADMRFKAVAMDQGGFDAWIAKAKAAAAKLDDASYAALTQNSKDDPVRYFGSVSPKLFGSILMASMAHEPRVRTIAANAAPMAHMHHQD